MEIIYNFVGRSLVCRWLKLLLLPLAIAVFTLLIFPGAISTASTVSIAEVIPDSSAVQPVLPETAPNRPSLDTSTIPSEKISQFVQAYLQVLNLIDRRQEELLAAETASESQRLERDIEVAALDIIDRAGLTKPEYLQMLSLANIDPEFGERIAARVQEVNNRALIRGRGL